MSKLQDILYKSPLMEVSGDLGIGIREFDFDSRKIGPGDLFVAMRGTQADGHNYIAKAVAQGAVAVVCEELPEERKEGVTWIKVADSAEALAFIAANYYGNPAEELKIVGVTGTNGKTTTASLLWKLFNALGYKTGLFSTVAVYFGEEAIPATHTTPDAKQLHSIFRQMVDDGCEYCFMEVSSHALVQKRAAGLPFAGAFFTNITHDHLDYHGSFREYINAKKILFDGLSRSAFAITNADDKNGNVMLQNSHAKRKSYGLKKMADYKARIVENTFEGLQLEIDEKEVWFRLIGSFNAYNLLAVYAVACELGMEQEEILLELSRLEGPEGRFQRVQSPDLSLTGIVDYAHTPDALKNVLHTIRDIRSGEGRIITVVGCGGNRDKDKRPVMGQIASELSDLSIFTSDNPRNEEPGAILTEMMAGVGISRRRKVMQVENREEAIKVACNMAQAEDIILVAGKGHETYQEIQGVRHPFDDRVVLLETFKNLRS